MKTVLLMLLWAPDAILDDCAERWELKRLLDPEVAPVVQECTRPGCQGIAGQENDARRLIIRDAKQLPTVGTL